MNDCLEGVENFVNIPTFEVFFLDSVSQKIKWKWMKAVVFTAVGTSGLQTA